MLWWHCNKRTLSLHGALRNVNPEAFTFLCQNRLFLLTILPGEAMSVLFWYYSKYFGNVSAYVTHKVLHFLK